MTGTTKPTDGVGAYWTVGTVTRGGAGPCYGVRTDVGIDLALYSAAGYELVEGSRISVRVSPAAFRTDCGAGDLMRLLQVRDDRSVD